MTTTNAYNYDEMLAIGDMDRFFTAVQTHCSVKLRNQTVAGYDKEDVTQEVLIKVMKAIDMYDSELSKATTFFSTVIERSIATIMRKAGGNNNLMNANTESTNASDSEDGECSVRMIPACDGGYDDIEFYIDIAHAVDLSDKEQEVLKLRMHGYDYVEIASHLGYKSKSSVNYVMKTIQKKFLKYNKD